MEQYFGSHTYRTLEMFFSYYIPIFRPARQEHTNLCSTLQNFLHSVSVETEHCRMDLSLILPLSFKLNITQFMECKCGVF